MANLATVNVSTDGDYETLSSLSGVTFTSGNGYTMQITGGSVFLREGTTGTGFMLTSSDPFTYVAGDDDLYIRADNATVNIAG